MFTPRLTAPTTSNAYYFSDNPFYNSGYGMPNCTAYAWGRFYEINPSERPRLSLHNADTWYSYNDGYNRGDTPMLGAILCFSGGIYSGDGHVCVVEEIKRNGEIVTSNSAYNGSFFYLTTLSPTNRYVPTGSGYNYQGFIYNPNISITRRKLPLIYYTKQGL